jgi:hypothetical protein
LLTSGRQAFRDAVLRDRGKDVRDFDSDRACMPTPISFPIQQQQMIKHIRFSHRLERDINHTHTVVTHIPLRSQGARHRQRYNWSPVSLRSSRDHGSQACKLKTRDACHLHLGFGVRRSGNQRACKKGQANCTPSLQRAPVRPPISWGIYSVSVSQNTKTLPSSRPTT